MKSNYNPQTNNKSKIYKARKSKGSVKERQGREIDQVDNLTPENVGEHMKIKSNDQSECKTYIIVFDENEKIAKKNLETWNDKNGNPVFGEDKKKSQSKNYKRIGKHLTLKNGDEYKDND
ncbi:hypothetical protein C1646_752072 [Rhizophagus diaphanus]|nr:hypothetical protein C1646_752072 [Rhizophagus diaphanus] [Rhizophagus sp. MUCL 43196]